MVWCLVWFLFGVVVWFGVACVLFPSSWCVSFPFNDDLGTRGKKKAHTAPVPVQKNVGMQPVRIKVTCAEPAHTPRLVQK